MSVRPELGGRVIGLSMSPPNDLARLGYPPREFDRLVLEISTAIVRAHGRIIYGGHLQEGSLTFDVFEHVAASYGNQQKADAGRLPFLHFLPFSELCKDTFKDVTEKVKLFRRVASIRVNMPGDSSFWLRAKRIQLDGNEGYGLEIRSDRAGLERRTIRDQAGFEAFLSEQPEIDQRKSLSLMRAAQSQEVCARIVLGGKRGDLGVADSRDRYGGAMPGIHEETLRDLKNGLPVAILAAFGGAARDVAVDLELLDERERTPLLGETQEGVRPAWQQVVDFAPRLDDARRKAMTAFAHRDDTEGLARDVVAWIADCFGPPDGTERARDF